MQNLILTMIVALIIAVILFYSQNIDFMIMLPVFLSIFMIFVNKFENLVRFLTAILSIIILRSILNIVIIYVILNKGYDSVKSASSIVFSFEEFVVSGNYVICIVTFCVLTLINFIIIKKSIICATKTKARFLLDGMPMKFMAIDAGLNAGMIDSTQAKIRHMEVEKYSDFFIDMKICLKIIKYSFIVDIMTTIIISFAGSLQLFIGYYLLGQIYGFIIFIAIFIVVSKNNIIKSILE